MTGCPGLTLRLRLLSGTLKMAGDAAISEGRRLISAQEREVRGGKQQVHRGAGLGKYGSWYKASLSDYGMRKEKGGTEVG